MTATEIVGLDVKAARAKAVRVGATAAVFTVLVGFFDGQQFFRSYLLAYVYVLALSLGALPILLLHTLSSGAWGFVIRRILEASVRTLPYVALGFVPIALGMHHLYEWSHAEAIAHDPILAEKAAYLNPTFWTVRAAVYFAIWIGFAFLVTGWARELDRTGDRKLLHRMQLVSGPGIALYVITLTFASVDWAMSLDPHWFSTVYGLLFVVGQVLTVFAFSTVLAVRIAPSPALKAVVPSPVPFHDLGKFMLAFTMLWAYVGFTQFLIIWSGNLAEETPWVAARTATSWRIVALFLVLFHFAIPFLLLLSRQLKRNLATLSRIASWMLIVRFVDFVWLLVPAFHPEGLRIHLLDLTALAALGGLWFDRFLAQLESQPLVPTQDPRLARAVEKATEHH